MGLTINVVRGANAERLLVLLHGLGADEHDLAPLAPHLDPDGRWLVVLPRGQYSAPPGYAWFQFGSPVNLAATLESSVESLNECIADACDRYGMPWESAVLGGFSQGAATALAIAYRKGASGRPAGVLAMSGFLAPSDRFEYEKSADLPPALFQHGTADPLVVVDRARMAARTIGELGAPVVYREYPMEHQISMDSIVHAREWLEDVRTGGRPSGDLPDVSAEPAPPPPSAVPAGDEPEELVPSVGSANFDAEVLRSPKPVIVDFWAPWCGPCRAVAPIVEQIAAMRKATYKVVKVNIDEAPDLAQRYQIQSIPMVAVFRNGRLERASMGAKPRPQLEAELGMLVIP